MLFRSPLDGGRVVYAILCLYLNKSKAQKICKATGLILGGLLTVVYFSTLKTVGNVSMLFFGVFVLVGALGIDKSGRYQRTFSTLSSQSLSRGVPVKRLALDGNVKVKKMMALLDGASVNEVLVYIDGKPRATLSQEKIEKIILTADLYRPISSFLHV